MGGFGSLVSNGGFEHSQQLRNGRDNCIRRSNMLRPAIAVAIDPGSTQTCLLCTGNIDLGMITDVQSLLCGNIRPTNSLVEYRPRRFGGTGVNRCHYIVKEVPDADALQIRIAISYRD
jgi:hypothetical protein